MADDPRTPEEHTLIRKVSVFLPVTDEQLDDAPRVFGYPQQMPPLGEDPPPPDGVT